MLEIPYGTCYSKTKEEQLPTSGCPHKQWLEKSTLVTRSKLGWFFYALNHYRQNVKTNVSNARMNIPKAIRSLKSKCFISTTPILCKNRGQPPCNTVIPFPYHSIFAYFISMFILLYSPQVFYIFRHYMSLIFLHNLCAEGFRNPT